MAGGDGDVRLARSDSAAIQRLEMLTERNGEILQDLRLRLAVLEGQASSVTVETVWAENLRRLAAIERMQQMINGGPIMASAPQEVAQEVLQGTVTDDQMAAIIERMRQAADGVRPMPVRSRGDLEALAKALGGDLGARHGEAVSRGEIGAVDAWQVALTALAHLRTCIDAALLVTPKADPDAG